MGKLERLLAEFSFTGLSEALGQRRSWRTKLPTFSVNGLSG